MAAALCLRDRIEIPAEKGLQNMNKYIHPNQITALRGVAAPFTLAVSTVSGPVAAALHGVVTAADWLDGAAARAGRSVANENGEMVKESLCSKEGAAFDPLTDKISTDTQLAVLAAMGDDEVFAALVVTNIVVDVASQCIGRGPILDQIQDGIRATLHPETCNYNQGEADGAKANFLGKAKMGLQSLVIGLKYLRDTDVANWIGLSPEMIDISSSTGLAVAAVFGAAGIAKRIKLSEKLADLSVKIKVKYPELESALRMCSF